MFVLYKKKEENGIRTAFDIKNRFSMTVESSGLNITTIAPEKGIAYPSISMDDYEIIFRSSDDIDFVNNWLGGLC